MQHKITLTQTDDEWEQEMVCNFANAYIAELIWEDTAKRYHDHKECLQVSGTARAELQREGKTITAICKKKEYFARCWSADHNTNKQELVILAHEWKKQEQAWLPIARYFSVVKGQMNERFGKLVDSRFEAMDNLREEYLAVERKTDSLIQSQKDYHDKSMELFEERNLRIEALERLCDGVLAMLNTHREIKFHFLDR